MIVNIHDGPWRCNACSTLYTRRTANCQRCHSNAIQKADLEVLWGDDVTAICQGLVAIQGEGKQSPGALVLDERARQQVEDIERQARGLPSASQSRSPCQPDAFPMQQSAALSAILESWPLHPTGDYLSTHIDHIAQNVGKLCEVATVIAKQLEKNRKTVERF